MDILTINKDLSKITPADIEHTICHIPKYISYTAIEDMGHGDWNGNSKPATTGTLLRTNPPT